MKWEDIKRLFRLLKNTDITEFHHEKDGEKIIIKMDKRVTYSEVPAAENNRLVKIQDKAQEVVPSDTESQGLFTVTSPIVGTFYRASSPDAPSFVEVGSEVKKGQVLCIIEAMKLMNEIESEVDGVIVRALAENGQPVEYGEPLFLVNPKGNSPIKV